MREREREREERVRKKRDGERDIWRNGGKEKKRDSGKETV